MSLHREVTVHCDVCGQWENGNARTTTARRRAGWLIWRFDGHGSLMHKCPRCARLDPRLSLDSEGGADVTGA